mgnify:CR=1 FL=1
MALFILGVQPERVAIQREAILLVSPFLDASRVVPTANENRPANVALPVALYIGLPA